MEKGSGPGGMIKSGPFGECKRIAITGPESTGKSTLSAALADHYQTVWVPEYAREYVAQLDRPYGLHDLEEIARGQLALEARMFSTANGVLISDTELLVIKIWSEHAFGHCPEWIIQEINRQPYDLYLLTGIDIAWEPDPQREHPHLREHFYNRYRTELQTRGLPFVEVWGTPQARLTASIEAIEKIMK